MVEERRYGGCSYRQGDKEDKTRCIKEVYSPREWHGHQCVRKRGYGPNGEYCKQHVKNPTFSFNWN